MTTSKWFPRVLVAAILSALCVTATSEARASATSPVGQVAATAALTQVGAPYVWGMASPSTGFDASGLVVWAYAKAALTLPHYTPALWPLGRHVPRQQLAIGDLVFFDGLAHVGIYVGNGRFIHAPHTGADVRVQALSSGLYGKQYVGAVRLKG
jgi:cell wall-associated NlpC family hydrolase